MLLFNDGGWTDSGIVTIAGVGVAVYVSDSVQAEWVSKQDLEMGIWGECFFICYTTGF